MLEETIDEIDDRADIEWKFARSKLYMEYIRGGNNKREKKAMRLRFFLIKYLIDIFLGNDLPVPFNIIPSPTSIITFFKQIKQMIIDRKSLLNKKEKCLPKHKEENILHINMGRMNTNRNINSNSVKNGKHVTRKRSSITNKKLTYKIVIERIIKRFLLYYKDSHIGLDEVKDGFEFREVKNDIASFRFELSYQIDVLQDMQISLTESMKKFNENLNASFDIKSMKTLLK